MSDEPARPGGDNSGDDDFDRIVAGLELSMPEDLEPPSGPAAEEPDVFDPKFSDPVEPDPETDTGAEGFVPPDPGPLPPLDTVSRGAWAVLFGAPAVLLVAVVLAWQLPQVVTGLLVLGFVGALVLLLVKRGNDSRGDDPDEGAVL